VLLQSTPLVHTLGVKMEIHKKVILFLMSVMCCIAVTRAKAVTHYVLKTGANVPPYTNWSSAAINVHVAVGYAEAGATVMVAKAAYLFESVLLLTNPITIISYSGPMQTVLDGAYSTRCVHVATSNVVLSGFSVIHGKADKGGGLFCDGDSVVISNCIFQENIAHYGGGMFFKRADSLVTHCMIISNIAYHPSPPANDWPKSGGGGIFCEDSPTRFENCLVAHNWSTNAAANGEGGGMMFFRPAWMPSLAATAVVVNCTISNNWTDYTGGGLACFGWDFDSPNFYQVEIYNTLFTGNSAQYGGAYYHCYWGTKPLLYNCIMRDNDATGNGVAIRVYDTFWDNNNNSGSTFENCTVTYNTGTNNYAVYISGSIMYMVNSIVWSNNTLSGVRVDASNASQEVAYSCIEGGYSGIAPAPGNIETNPVFACLEEHDWRLSASSPCIDSGTNRVWMMAGTDYAGHPRLFNTQVDMGADEAYIGIDPESITNKWQIPWIVIPEGVYAWQQSTTSIDNGWASLSGIFTATTDRVEMSITNRSPQCAWYRLQWQR